MLKDLLKHSALFKNIPAEVLDAMADKMHQESFSAGDVVFRRDSASDALYFVISGQAEIIEEKDLEGAQTTYVGAGDFLGEKTVLAGKPRTATVKAMTDVRLARLDRADLEILTLLHPELETVLGEAESRPNIEEILRNLPLFADLPASVLRAIAKKMTIEVFKKGEVVFRQGDEGDKLYLILSGQVKILVDDGEYERVVSYLGQDSFFGEMALISDTPRTASVEVSVDVRLLSLRKEDFLQLLDKYPGIALTISRYAVRRVEGLAQLAEVREYQIVAVVGNSGIELARRLVHYTKGRVILYRLPGVPEGEEQGLEDIFISDAPDTIDTEELVEILSILISGFDKVLMFLPPVMNRLTVKALELANATAVIGMDVAPWIKVSSGGEVWRADDAPTAIDLLARRILRRVIGVALSSGNGRSIAHVGVLQVLAEAGIPIDFIAGTSGGALFGGLYAAGIGLDAVKDFALNLHKIAQLKLFGGLADYNIFNLSRGIIKGHKVVDFLDGVIKHKSFRELEIPTYMVATDVITGEEVVLDNGSVALAMRASFSIEGIFVPAEIDGRYLMDGAAVNPVPCSVLAERGADIIIASSVIPALEERVQRKALRESKRIPNILNVMLGKTEVMESEIVKTKMSPVDVVIKPEVGLYPATEFDKAPDFIRLGYEAAMLEIEHIKGLIER